jgi:NADH-quinone oxidoreductase subunit M
VVFGPLTKESLMGLLDVDWREALLLVPLVVLTIFFGVYPAPILDATAAATRAVVAEYQGAVGQPKPIVMPAPVGAGAADQ